MDTCINLYFLNIVHVNELMLMMNMVCETIYIAWLIWWMLPSYIRRNYISDPNELWEAKKNLVLAIQTMA